MISTRPGDGDLVLMAARHVREGERIVIQQKARIAHLEARGADTTDAEALLNTFVTTLKIFQDHLREL
jgi:hypothetical protein